MALQSSGKISHSDIMAEFNKTGSFKLSADGASLINKSPSTKIKESDFYGASASEPIVIVDISGASIGGRDFSSRTNAAPSLQTPNIDLSYYQDNLAIGHSVWWDITGNFYAAGNDTWRPVHDTNTTDQGLFQTMWALPNSLQPLNSLSFKTDHGGTSFTIDSPWKSVSRIYSLELQEVAQQTCSRRASAPAPTADEAPFDIITAVGPDKDSGNVPSTPTGFREISSGDMIDGGYVRTWVDTSGSTSDFSISNPALYMIRGYRVYLSTVRLSAS